jgi:hypothetical protein
VNLNELASEVSRVQESNGANTFLMRFSGSTARCKMSKKMAFLKRKTFYWSMVAARLAVDQLQQHRGSSKICCLALCDNAVVNCSEKPLHLKLSISGALNRVLCGFCFCWGGNSSAEIKNSHATLAFLNFSANGLTVRAHGC